jgi:hypothetical protein
VFRIRIRMDPHSIGRPDPDPHKTDADPKHWIGVFESCLLLVSHACSRRPSSPMWGSAGLAAAWWIPWMSVWCTALLRPLPHSGALRSLSTVCWTQYTVPIPNLNTPY